MKRNYWPIFFIGIFTFVFSMIVWTVKSAVSLPVIEDHSFMKKYQDVDENYNLASSNNIRNVPTVILVDKNGNEINRTIGVKSEDYFIENYRNNLAM